MLVGASPTVQALLATCFTWFVTALGAALVFLVPRNLSERKQRMLLDGSLGFAAGVMLAASYWSLLKPALESAEESGAYGEHSYFPVCVGLLAGAAFVYGADLLIPHGAGDAVTVLTSGGEHDDAHSSGHSKKHDGEDEQEPASQRLLQQQHAPPPLHRAGSMSRKRNASSGRLSLLPSDEAVDEMEAHRLPPLAGSGKSNKLKQSPPPAVAPLTRQQSSRKKGSRASSTRLSDMVPVEEVAEHEGVPVVWGSASAAGAASNGVARAAGPSDAPLAAASSTAKADRLAREKAQSWHRILLLVIAIVIHNFPEGLAVGVGFGALSELQPPEAAMAAGTDADALAAASMDADSEQARQSAYSARFAEACTLAVGIGLQNFPEGLAVSLPLLRVGYSRTTAFFYGQLSGMVEPLGGLLGAALIGLMRPLLPYALSFAAGAMIFVVVDDLVPETRTANGFPRLASMATMVGFCVMMSMDVFFG